MNSFAFCEPMRSDVFPLWKLFHKAAVSDPYRWLRAWTMTRTSSSKFVREMDLSSSLRWIMNYENNIFSSSDNYNKSDINENIMWKHFNFLHYKSRPRIALHRAPASFSTSQDLPITIISHVNYISTSSFHHLIWTQYSNIQ
jgi:hypothetical protein